MFIVINQSTDTTTILVLLCTQYVVAIITHTIELKP